MNTHKRLTKITVTPAKLKRTVRTREKEKGSSTTTHPKILLQLIFFFIQRRLAFDNLQNITLRRRIETGEKQAQPRLLKKMSESEATK